MDEVPGSRPPPARPSEIIGIIRLFVVFVRLFRKYESGEAAKELGLVAFVDEFFSVERANPVVTETRLSVTRHREKKRAIRSLEETSRFAGRVGEPATISRYYVTPEELQKLLDPPRRVRSFSGWK